jgi:hypothetical protein
MSERISGKDLYPTTKSIEKALEERTKQKKLNYPHVLYIENPKLYRRILEEEISIPKDPARNKPFILPPRFPTTVAETEENERKSLIAVFEEREARGEENFPDVLDKDLLERAQKFMIELPQRDRLPVIYHAGDKLKNCNPKDPTVYKKIGEVLSANRKEVVVDFGRNIGKRVYEKWRNLRLIVPLKNKSKALVPA